MLVVGGVDLWGVDDRLLTGWSSLFYPGQIQFTVIILARGHASMGQLTSTHDSFYTIYITCA